MKNNLLFLFLFIVTASIADASTRALSDRGAFSRLDACQGQSTHFTAESTVSFRERMMNRDRREMATVYDQNQRPEVVCRSSDRRRAREDATQVVVATDLLSRTKEKVLDQMFQSIRNATELSRCEGRPQCSSAESYRSTARQMDKMRRDLAISQMPVSCFNASGTATLVQIEGMLRACLSRNNARIAHPEGAFAETAEWLGGRSANFERNLNPLTAGEIEFLSKQLASRVVETRSGAQSRGVAANMSQFGQDIRRAAELSYQTAITQNPVLRYLKSSSPANDEYRNAIASSISSMTEARDRLKNTELHRFATFRPQMNEVLRDMRNSGDSQYRGDYCEMANFLAQDQQNLEAAQNVLRTAGMFGLGFMGVPGAMLAGAVSTASYANNQVEYMNRMQECAGENMCRPGDLTAARALTEIDIASVASFGAGAGGLALSRYIAGNATATRQILGMSDEAAAAYNRGVRGSGCVL